MLQQFGEKKMLQFQFKKATFENSSEKLWLKYINNDENHMLNKARKSYL